MDLVRKRYAAISLAGGTIFLCLWLCSRLASAKSEHSSRRKYPQSTGPLSQVNPEMGEKDTDIDIIAIHGLDATAPDTWTWVDRNNPENRVNWLQDSHMLPSKVERVRIFTYNWPADLLQPSDLVQKTEDEFAALLFEVIHRQLQSTSDHARSGERPILFIASCLGGILLMKALTSTGEYQSVRRAIRGIVFLATPFGGTSFQDVSAFAEPGLRVWASIRGREVSNLLSLLSKGKGSAFDLKKLVREFTQLCKEEKYQVFNFYEKGKTSLPSKVFPWLPSWLRQEKQVRS
jgi:hypothetical protein